MAITALPYWGFVGLLGEAQIALPSDTFKVMLLGDSYPVDPVEDLWVDDINGHEISGAGYTAGGETLTSVAWGFDATGPRYRFTAGNLTWTALTADFRYAAVYKDVGGVAADSPLVSYVDFGEEQSLGGDDFTMTWSADGIVAVESA